MNEKPVRTRKRGLGVDVLTAARHRIARVFDDFPRVYLSFSGGKDSGVALELAAEEARRRGRTLGVLIVDLEAQYTLTIDYIRTMLARHADVIEPYWVALPIALRNAVSDFEPKWMCWDPDKKAEWVRSLPDLGGMDLPRGPGVVAEENYFDFFRRGMEFEEFTPEFGDWYSRQGGGDGEAELTACIVAIRTQESLNRWRTITRRNKRMHDGLCWTTWVQGTTYNAYPIYDWKTEDVWRYYGSQGVPYNVLYDRMHKAGLTIHQARICHPYGDDQKRGLWLFHIIEPETWARVVARVSDANFGARHARDVGNVMGRVRISKPGHLSWEEFAGRMLNSMPPKTADHYRDKIAGFLKYYTEKGCSAEKLEELRAYFTKQSYGVEEVEERMQPAFHHYRGGWILDDGPMTKGFPSWRRVCKVLLSYDYYCKGLTFSPTNPHAEQRYKQIQRARRARWGFDIAGSR